MFSRQKYPPNGCAPSATPNHSIPRYTLRIISALFDCEGGQTNPGRALFRVSVYLGRFHRGELFYEQTFYVHMRLQLRRQRREFGADRKVKKKALFLHPKLQRITFDLTTKGNADSLTIIQVLPSHIFQHLGVALKMASTNKTQPADSSKVHKPKENVPIPQTRMLKGS